MCSILIIIIIIIIIIISSSSSSSSIILVITFMHGIYIVYLKRTMFLGYMAL